MQRPRTGVARAGPPSCGGSADVRFAGQQFLAALLVPLGNGSLDDSTDLVGDVVGVHLLAVLLGQVLGGVDGEADVEAGESLAHVVGSSPGRTGDAPSSVTASEAGLTATPRVT